MELVATVVRSVGTRSSSATSWPNRRSMSRTNRLLSRRAFARSRRRLASAHLILRRERFCHAQSRPVRRSRRSSRRSITSLAGNCAVIVARVNRTDDPAPEGRLLRGRPYVITVATDAQRQQRRHEHLVLVLVLRVRRQEVVYERCNSTGAVWQGVDVNTLGDLWRRV